MAFNLCDSLSIPKHSRSSFRSNCRGDSNVQNSQAGSCSRAHRVERHARFRSRHVEPAPPPVYRAAPSFGGWYIRGDLDYHWADFRGADYITYGVTCCGAPDPGSNSFDFGDLDGAFSLGAGVGYQITNYLRTDLTADYWFDSDFNGQTSDARQRLDVDTSSWSTWLLLANAYADLGT